MNFIKRRRKYDSEVYIGFIQSLLLLLILVQCTAANAVDSLSLYAFDDKHGIARSCAWLAERPVEHSLYCTQTQARIECSATCSDYECPEDNSASFSENPSQTCGWLKHNMQIDYQFYHSKYCGEGLPARYHCPRACGICSDPADTPSEVPSSSPSTPVVVFPVSSEVPDQSTPSAIIETNTQPPVAESAPVTPEMYPCSVCGDGKHVTAPPGTTYYPPDANTFMECSMIEFAGEIGSFTKEQCELFPVLLATECQCAPIQGSTVTPAPSTYHDTSEDTTIGGGGGVLEPQVPAQVTLAPVTFAPFTSDPVSPAPVTFAPVTPAPVASSNIPPSYSPTPFPTPPPTPDPTPTPTPPPTPDPTPYPTPPPTPDPTPYPTPPPASSSPTRATQAAGKFPDLPPAVVVTIDYPSESPSILPTEVPSVTTTIPPSLTPTDSPTNNPTFRPSDRLSTTPTSYPTFAPSVELSSFPTMMLPSTTPSFKPTLRPTNFPSTTPSDYVLTIQNMTRNGITMFLGNAGYLNKASIETWQEITSSAIANEIRTILKDDVVTLNVIVTLTDQMLVSQSVRSEDLWNRNLNDDLTRELRLVFNVEILLRSNKFQHDVDRYISGAFNSLNDQQVYVLNLRESGEGSFAKTLTVGISIPIQNEETIEKPRSNEGSSLNVGLVAGLAGLGLGFVGLALFFLIYRWRRRVRVVRNDEAASVAHKTVLRPSSSSPMNHEFGGVAEDDISTIGDPLPPGMVRDEIQEDPTIAGSVSLPWDVQQEVRGAGGSVSLDENSNNSNFLSKDDCTLENQYNAVAQFDVMAPPGLLGLVLESSLEDGVPTVHAIKPTSPLADLVKIGDRLISVDGIDVAYRHASEVSRMIAERRDQPSRTFIFSRGGPPHLPNEDSMQIMEQVTENNLDEKRDFAEKSMDVAKPFLNWFSRGEGKRKNNEDVVDLNSTEINSKTGDINLDDALMNFDNLSI